MDFGLDFMSFFESYSLNHTHTINLKGNLSPMFIFRLALWVCWTLDEICLRQPNIVRAESKFVRPQMPCACMSSSSAT